LKPLIGILPDLVKKGHDESHIVNSNYVKAISKAGAIPILLSYSDIDKNLFQMIAGFLLVGGGIYDKGANPKKFVNKPLSFTNPKRYAFEKKLIMQIVKARKPVFGICRGAQMLIDVFGGVIINDITKIQKINHQKAFHSINLLKGSFLRKLARCDKIKVNSNHHKGICSVPTYFQVSAKSIDGFVEAFENKKGSPVIGVQFHPETLLHKPFFFKLFKYFIQKCKSKQSKPYNNPQV